MKIKSFFGSKIFNTLNFNLKFNPDVNILYGINGCGKTTVLIFMNRIFNCEFRFFESVQFQEIKLEYEYKDEIFHIILTKNPKAKKGTKLLFSSNHHIANTTFQEYENLKKDPKNNTILYSRVYKRNTEKWRSIFKSIFISIKRGMKDLDSFISIKQMLRNDEFRFFLKEFTSTNRVDLPESEIRTLYNRFIRYRSNDPRVLHSAKQYSEEYPAYSSHYTYSTNPGIDNVQKIIQRKLIDFNNYSKKLEEDYTKDSYQKVTSMIKSNEIKKRLKKINKSSMKSLIKEINNQANKIQGKIEIPSNKDFNTLLLNLGREQGKIKNKEEISMEYVILFVQFLKIAELTVLLKRMNETKIKKLQKFILLISKLNEFFEETGKNASIEHQKGIEIHVKSEKTQKIPLNSLSSGEKQILIFFTYLIFESDKEIMLYDEPDLSLHIDWQEKFIDSIREINPKIQIFLATHSVAICGSNYFDKQIPIEIVREK